MPNGAVVRHAPNIIVQQDATSGDLYFYRFGPGGTKITNLLIIPYQRVEEIAAFDSRPSVSLGRFPRFEIS